MHQENTQFIVELNKLILFMIIVRFIDLFFVFSLEKCGIGPWIEGLANQDMIVQILFLLLGNWYERHLQLVVLLAFGDKFENWIQLDDFHQIANEDDK